MATPSEFAYFLCDARGMLADTTESQIVQVRQQAIDIVVESSLSFILNHIEKEVDQCKRTV